MDARGFQQSLQAIDRQWQRVLQSNRALRSEVESLKARIAVLERSVREEVIEGKGGTSADAHRVREQWAPHGPAIADIGPPASPATSPASAHAPSKATDAIGWVDKRSVDAERSQSSLDESTDHLFRILFDERQRKRRQGTEQQRLEETAASQRDNAEVIVQRAQVQSQTHAMNVDNDFDAAAVAGAGEHRPVESESSADRLLMELEAEEGHTAIDHAQGRGERDSKERTEVADVAHGHPESQGAQLQGRGPLDAFTTQDITGEPQLSAHSAEHKAASVEDDARTVLSTASAERHHAKELYLLHDFYQALSLYTAADGRLSAILGDDRNRNRPAVLQTAYAELATVLASRAAIHIKLGRLAAAQADVSRLRTFRAEWWKTFALQARVLVGERRLEEAIAVYEEGLRGHMPGEERRKLQRKKDHAVKTIQSRRWSAGRPVDGDSPVHPHEQPPTIPLPVSPMEPSTPRSAQRNPLEVHVSPARTQPLTEDGADGSSQQTPSPHPPVRSTPVPPSPISPSPSKTSTMDYSVLPRITLEGVRDLLGADLFLRAEESVAAVYKLRVVREEDDSQSKAGIDDTAVLLQAKCKRGGGRPRKRRRYDVETAFPLSGQDEGGRPELIDVDVRFRGNRVMDWACSCCGPSPQMTEEAEAKAKDDEGGAPVYIALLDAGERDHHDTSIVPCHHVGAVLLLVRNKQTAASSPSARSSQPPLYVHPSHVLPAAVVATIPALRERFAFHRTDRLKHLLQLNGERQSGVKEELVERCVEGAVRGVLPKCDRCGGNLFYANGRVLCRGVFDVDRRSRVECGVHMHADAVQRRPWRSD